MTREELKAHCEKQIKECEKWAKHKGEEPSGKVYEEHKLILELLEQEPFINKPCVSNGVCEHDKNKVLNKIRAEINKQEKWLLQAGYTAYNVDIAFDAIKAVVAESEDT